MRSRIFRHYLTFSSAKWRNACKTIRKKHASTDNAHRPSEEQKGRLFSVRISQAKDAHEQHWHAEEREHHRVERAYWRDGVILARREVLLTAIAAGGAVFAAVIGDWAYKEAHTQANAAVEQVKIAVAGQRSWLYVEFPHDDPHVSQEQCPPAPGMPPEIPFPPFTCVTSIDHHNGTKSYSVSIKVNLRNVGHIPAQITSINATLYAIPGNAAATFPLDTSGKMNAGVVGADVYQPDTLRGKIIPSGDTIINTDGSAVTQTFIVNNLPGSGESFGFFPKWIWFVIKYSDPYGEGRETGFMVKAKWGEMTVESDRRYTYEK